MTDSNICWIEINEVHIEWTLKKYRNKRRTDKMRTELTQTTLITPASIHYK